MFYSTFLNQARRIALTHVDCADAFPQVESPEKVLKAEFIGELLFLPVAALCLFFAKSLTVMIVVVGGIWWGASVDWTPEVIDGTTGTNVLFMAGWMCTSSVISALLLSAIFIVSHSGSAACASDLPQKQVSEVYSEQDHPKVICIGLFLLMVGGCSASVAFDTGKWISVMANGLVRIAAFPAAQLEAKLCSRV